MALKRDQWRPYIHGRYAQRKLAGWRASGRGDHLLLQQLLARLEMEMELDLGFEQSKLELELKLEAQRGAPV